jgi:hypothetical protein
MSRAAKPRGPAYEASEIEVARVVLFTVALVAACALFMGAMVWLYGRFEIRERAAVRGLPPATRVEPQGRAHPPDPVLQGAPGSLYELQDPSLEWERERARVRELLTSSGWVDREAGVVRIPIEQAKRLLLARGLPVREPEPAP